MQIADTPTTLTVDRLTSSWINNSIRPNPEYQRGSTWRLRQQQLLVDSVLRGYPLPRFYFEKKESSDPIGNQQVTLDVIDGQQRLIALSQYREDRWPLFDVSDEKIPLPPSIRRTPAPWSGKTFSALSQDLQQQFLDIEMSVVLIDVVHGDEVRDLFIRLQSGTPLSAQQVRDAWPGAIGPYIERLAGKGTRQGAYHAFFSAVDRRGSAARSEDEYEDPSLDARQTCAQLLHLHLSKEKGRGYPSVRGGALNDLYHENTEFDTKGQLAKQFEDILDATQMVIAFRPAGSGKKVVRKSRIFSLFLFVRMLQYSPVNMPRAIEPIATLFWKAEVDESEPPARVASSESLERHFVWFVDERMSSLRLPELDRDRLFSQNQKQEIWQRANGLCGICGKEVSERGAEYDHITPWILGGPTDIANGRPVHSHCHARGLAAAVDGRSAPTVQA